VAHDNNHHITCIFSPVKNLYPVQMYRNEQVRSVVQEPQTNDLGRTTVAFQPLQ
jgi:hypothetical protein